MRTTTPIKTATIVMILLLSAAASAQEEEPRTDDATSETVPMDLAMDDISNDGDAPTDADRNVLLFGLKAGVALPQVGSEYGTTFGVHLEVDYLAPLLGSRLGAVTALGYSQPGADGSGTHENLPGGEYTWETTQRQLIWDLGLLARLMPYDSAWNIGLATGLRLTFVSTDTNGEAGGESFGEHTETGTLPGFFLAAQGDYRLGPGSIYGEFGYSLTAEDLKTTGDVSVSALAILAGYRVQFAL